MVNTKLQPLCRRTNTAWYLKDYILFSVLFQIRSQPIGLSLPDAASKQQHYHATKSANVLEALWHDYTFVIRQFLLSMNTFPRSNVGCGPDRI